MWTSPNASVNYHWGKGLANIIPHQELQLRIPPHPLSVPKVEKKELKVQVLISSKMPVKNPRGFGSSVTEEEKKKGEKKNTHKKSDNTAVKMADDEYNIHCKSIHQIKANVLRGEILSLTSNESLLPKRSATIFSSQVFQGSSVIRIQFF